MGKEFTKTILCQFINSYQPWADSFHAMSGICLGSADDACRNNPTKHLTKSARPITFLLPTAKG